MEAPLKECHLMNLLSKSSLNHVTSKSIPCGILAELYRLSEQN